jgi:hypothetical protein
MPLKIHYTYRELFGELYYLHDVNNMIKRRQAMFECKCGNKFIAQVYKVKTGETQSCGCFHKKRISESNSTHGLSGHPLYTVWKSAKARCYNKNLKSYSRYGGKGVVMCEDWKNNFMSFYKWAKSNGWAKGLELDKDIKGNGLLYCPNSCSFVTPKVNSNKRKTSKYIHYNGVSKTVSEWADFYKISLRDLYRRMYRGWNFEKCIDHARSN